MTSHKKIKYAQLEVQLHECCNRAGNWFYPSIFALLSTKLSAMKLWKPLREVCAVQNCKPLHQEPFVSRTELKMGMRQTLTAMLSLPLVTEDTRV